jgi:S1-C subfamily serine protease
VITAIDGKQITGMEDLISAINAKQPGDSVTLTVLRNGSSQDIDVKLADRPASVQG